MPPSSFSADISLIQPVFAKDRILFTIGVHFTDGVGLYRELRTVYARSKVYHLRSTYAFYSSFLPAETWL
jgi:hypothetical protein